MGRNCKDCGKEIPVKRLEAKPNATNCVPCLEKAGDVRRVKRYDEHDYYGNEIAHVYFTDDAALETQMRRIATCPHLPTGDELLEDDTNEIILEAEHMASAFENDRDAVVTAKNNINNDVAGEAHLPGKILVIQSNQEAHHAVSEHHSDHLAAA